MAWEVEWQYVVQLTTVTLVTTQTKDRDDRVATAQAVEYFGLTHDAAEVVDARIVGAFPLFRGGN
jgi:hypothetical protein